MNDIETIKEIYRRYWKCMIDKENGNTATMVGKSKVLAAVYGGSKSRWRLRGDFTLRKENENWKLTSSKASTY